MPINVVDCVNHIRDRREVTRRDKLNNEHRLTKETNGPNKIALVQAITCQGEHMAAWDSMLRVIDGDVAKCHEIVDYEIVLARGRIQAALQRELPKEHPYVACLLSFYSALRAVDRQLVLLA